MDVFGEMERRYRQRDLPWDQRLPPPEVMTLASTVRPGRALDLGCGVGRASIYLAQRGWHCDGVDFVPEAVAMARIRAEESGVADSARFHTGSVTQLDMLEPPYDLAIDVGCLHNLRGDDLAAYAAGVARLVRPAGDLLLFAHLAGPDADISEHGILEQLIYDTLEPDFITKRVEHGTTTVNDQIWPSAWLWLRRAPLPLPWA